MKRKAQFLAVSIFVLAPAALAQTQDEIKSQEQWLRYSNWEHRSSRPRSTELKATPVPSKPAQEASAEAKPDGEFRLPLPERPGSQTVEGGQFTIPGWAFQQPQQAQRPAEIIIGAPLGARLGFQSRLGYMGAGGFCGGGFLPGGYGRGWAGGFRQSRLGPQVIQTGPSHPSGNYYQPSTADPSSSGGYYASGAPWQVPVQGSSNPQDYWGPQGSPFK